MLTLGVDIGGTSVKLAVVDQRGRVVDRGIVPTPAVVTPRQMAALIVQAAKPLRGAGRIRGVGVGVPGLVDVERGVVHTLVNIRGWRHVPLRRVMQAAFGIPVAVDNDVNLLALAEARFGAGRGARSLVCLALGTGVGGAIVLDGQLYRGVTSSAGEVGHMPIERSGPRCGCGGWGCLEAYIGNRRIVARARRLMRHRAGHLSEALTPESLSRAAARGDRLARSLWEAVALDLAVAVAGVVNILNPDRIVIGGGVAQAGRWLFEPLRRAVRERAMAVPARAARIVPAALGTDAGAIGAATLVREYMEGTRRGHVENRPRSTVHSPQSESVSAI